jgi:hypothetical protein
MLQIIQEATIRLWKIHHFTVFFYLKKIYSEIALYTLNKLSGQRKWSLGSIKHQNYTKTTESVWLSLYMYMKDNENVDHPSHPLAPA